jgi:hypothetical protein
MFGEEPGGLVLIPLTYHSFTGSTAAEPSEIRGRQDLFVQAQNNLYDVSVASPTPDFASLTTEQISNHGWR